MNLISIARYAAACAGLGALALLSLNAASEAQGQSSLIQDGKIGFVVASISYAVADSQDVAAMCPHGLSRGPTDIFAASPEGQRREGETDAEYSARLRIGSRTALTAPNGQNLCAHPEAGAPDPQHPLLTGDVASFGIDLDGQVSRRNGRPAPGTCAHDDFRGVNGVRGVDNQFLRAVGCTNALSPGGQMNSFDTQMLTGAWGILLTLEDVQDLRNDDDVAVRLYSNADPIQLSPNRTPLPNATYAFIRDPEFLPRTHGRIVNGVLTTDPVDVKFTSRSARPLHRTLRDMRLQATIDANGNISGIMAGYTPVEAAYDTSVGFRPSDPTERAPAASGFATTARHTCNGVYFALYDMADGHRDPETGRCTSISTQYRLTAIPAFVVDNETRSLNEDLAEH